MEDRAGLVKRKRNLPGRVSGPIPTSPLVANSSNLHSYIMVGHDTSESSGNRGQFATSVNICATSRKVAL
jgi:hypothetical protein